MIHSGLLLMLALTAAEGEVSPGSVGWGLTVFQGTEPDTFGVEVIGTLRGTVPEEDRILVRVTGPLAERTGVASGMSGSPVYIGERLLGALASTFSFAAEPAGVVTPIGAMLKPKASWAGPGDVTPLPMIGASLGFDSPALDLLSSSLPVGISFTGGGREPVAGDLWPGHVCAVLLVHGDWVLAVMGTVTWRSDDRVAMFGHQLLGLGEVDLPLAGGSVVATLANRALSFKMSNPGGPVGAITYDGGSGLLGEVGRIPQTLPVRIESGGARPCDIDVRLALHPQLTPLLLRSCVVNCGGMVGGAGAGTVSVTMTASFPGGARRSVERVEVGAGGFIRLAEDVGNVLDAVMNCPLGRVVPESLVLELGVQPERPVYYLESVTVADGAGHPSRTVRVTARLLTRDRVPVDRSVHLQLPEAIGTGALRLEVGDAATTAQWERERAALPHFPATAERYLDELFSAWSPRGLYVRIVTDGRGWARREGEVARLPRSTAAVLGRAAQRGRHDLTSMSVVSRAEIMLDGPVYGSTIIDLKPSKEGRSQ